VLREEINNALKAALKAGDKRRVSTLRMVNAGVKNADIEARGQGKGALSDQELRGLLQKMMKQRREAIELYEKGGRADLAQQEREEMEIIAGYLPQQMAQDEAETVIAALVKELGAEGEGPKAMGRVMAVLKDRYAGAVDLAKASAILKRLLVP
jgi:uncharacterized protein YqeY